VAYAFAGATEPPEAYTGGNDWWHIHTQTCFGLDPQKFPDPDELSDEDCRALGGSPQKIFPAPAGQPSGVWLLHLWPIAPYEYRPDLFVSGRPCLQAHGAAPLSDPCWRDAHRDPAAVPAPTTTTAGAAGGGDASGGDHGDSGHGGDDHGGR
jgi:hypothetical protein